MTWGTGPWGFTPWGGGASLALASALAVNTRTVRVTFTSPPRAQSERGPGDALNPASWAVTIPATGRVYDVLRIEARSAYVYDVRVLELFERYGVTHRVDAAAVRSPADTVLMPPRALSFPGVVASVASRMEIGQYDIAQPPFDTDTQRGGVYQFTSGGDHALEGGAALFYKLVVRRLVTPTGAYFHLTDYGVGFKVKEPTPLSDLVVLKAWVERQVQAEPDTVSVNAELSLDADGVLSIAVRAIWRGEPSVAAFAMPSPFVVL
jgi:hypothetical protein